MFSTKQLAINLICSFLWFVSFKIKKKTPNTFFHKAFFVHFKLGSMRQCMLAPRDKQSSCNSRNNLYNLLTSYMLKIGDFLRFFSVFCLVILFLSMNQCVLNEGN